MLVICTFSTKNPRWRVRAEACTPAERLGSPNWDITSGAGHDACNLALVAPTAMIFVPCEKGISHNELENAKPKDLAAGCDVLLRVLLERAGEVASRAAK